MYTPFTNNWDAMIARQGQATIDVNADNVSSWDRVSPGYLEMMGQHIVRGRSITEQDTASTPGVAVVDEAFVKKFFKPGEEPLGAHFGMNDVQYSGTYEIVGVVKYGKLHRSQRALEAAAALCATCATRTLQRHHGANDRRSFAPD